MENINNLNQNSNGQNQQKEKIQQNVSDQLVEIINLTKHPVVLYNAEGTEILYSIPPAGKNMKVEEVIENVGYIGGIKVVRPIYIQDVKDGEELPPKKEGTIYLVSPIALQSLPKDRDDFFTVYDPVKNDKKEIIGHKAIARPSIYGKNNF